MRHPTTWPLLIAITILTVFSVLVIWPGYPKDYGPNFIDYPEGPIIDVGNDAMRLGLDLKGGTYLLTEANLAALPPDRDPDEAMEAAKRLLEDRVNEFGVSETEVTREGRNRIAIQIPGVPPEQARNLIGRTALLNFREPDIASNGQVNCVANDGTRFSVPPTGLIRGSDDQGKLSLGCNDTANQRTGDVVWKPAAGSTAGGATRQLTGAHVTDSKYTVDPRAGDLVELTFNQEGGRIFEEVTGRLAGYKLGIFLDDELISVPDVSGAISGGSTVIQGLTRDEAKDLAKLISGGALPVPLTTIQATEVDATLGERTLVRGVQAGIIGIMAVMAFMVLYYRLPGVLASMALFTYIVVAMMVFKLGPVIGPVTITLAGIAGFVLSVGMAVDANILVFERLKEELRSGRNLGQAIEHGFDRAWSSIRDSNVSTLITCAILWWFGDQFNAALVKGFALTLALGVMISMFSAITVTRTLLRAVAATPLARTRWLFGGDLRPAEKGGKPFAFDFVKRRGFYFLLSALVLVPGVIALAAPPHLKTGIEFSSGATFTVRFEDSGVSQGQVERALSDLGHSEARVQRTAEGNFIIRTDELNVAPGPPVGPTPPSERDELESGLRERLGEFRTLNFNQVSEIISSSIVYDAIIAVLFAAAAILVYITWSFRNIPQSYRYGIAAVFAALHDAVFVLGAFAMLGHLFGMEIDSLFITGVLTVIGFSVHDTIVVFDRVRENVATNPGVRFDEVVNASLTETLARSLNTSGTVVLTLVALLLLGSGSIDVLLITLLIGIISGTYSSIFIASQILVSWEDGDFDPFFRALTFWRRGGGGEELSPTAASTRS
jgi:protein-export membrane protein SecD/preprotein translocase SecF subunit